MKIFVVFKEEKPIRMFEERWAAENCVKNQYYRAGVAQIRVFTEDGF